MLKPELLGAKVLAEREGFPACENADCTLCCWEGHSTLSYTAHGWNGKSYGQPSAVEPLSTYDSVLLGQTGQTKRKRPVCSLRNTQSPCRFPFLT